MPSEKGAVLPDKNFEMKYAVIDKAKSRIKDLIENCKKYLVKGLKVHSKTVNLFTVESNISKQLEDIQKKYDKFVEIGSYPFFHAGKLGVSIVLRSEQQSKIDTCSAQILNFIKEKKIEIVDR